ncbi:Acetyltransferase (GNAT) domain-containing protein [Lachnospiraceae bacterium YSD2013]|nr:Acetyltransferase (GNAT) domain-containing protein [Lachnospiraceae bacterium YSD2013]
MISDSIKCVNSVFEQPWWLDIVAPGEWNEVSIEENGEIIARLPYVMKRKRMCMPFSTQTLGVWIKDEIRAYQVGNVQLSKQKEIIGKLFEKLPKHKSVNVFLDSSNDYILPYRWMGFRFEPSFSYRICDLRDLDLVYENFNKTAKKNIKAGQKKTHLLEAPTTEKMIQLLRVTYQVQGRRIPGEEDLIKRIMDASIERGNGKLFIAADDNNNVHAGAFILYDAERCYYLFGGSDSKYRTSGAQSYILWEAIKYASKVSKAFDFEGSNIEGIENFFRQFGGERVINYNIIKQSLLADFLCILKPRIKKIVGYKN